MEYAQEEIVKALRIIQGVCDDHICKDCPFSYDKKGCAITNATPTMWEIVEPDAAWHAIR